ncbi:sensor histidine kinase [Chitinophagaceae bacterium MMS25-I14]
MSANYLLKRISCIAVYCVFAASVSYAQISKELYQRLPGDIKPKDPAHITNNDKKRIVGYADRFATQKDTLIIHELDRLSAELEQEGKKASRKTQATNLAAVAEYYRLLKYKESPRGEWVPYCERIIQLTKGDTALLSTLGAAYMQIGNFYSSTGKYEDAQTKYFEALDQFKKNDDSGAMRVVYSLLSLNYSYMGLHKESMEYHEISNSYFTAEEKADGTQAASQLEDYYSKSEDLLNLYGKSGNHDFVDSARQYIRKMRVLKTPDTSRLMEYYYAALWYSYYKTSHYDSTLIYIDSSLAIENHFLDMHNQTMAVKGICLLRTGHREAGKKLLLSNPGINTDLSLAKLIYGALYKDARDRGDAASALKYFEMQKVYEDSAAVLEQRGKVYEITQKYNVKEKQSEINTLALKSAAQQKQRNFIVVTAVSIVLLLLAVIALLYALAKKRLLDSLHIRQALEQEKGKMERFLLVQDNRIREVREAAVLKQRQKISHDLHDGLGSTLAALRYYINDVRMSSESEAQRQQLRDIEMEVAAIYAQTRDYMHSLNKGGEQAGIDLHEFLSGLSAQFSNAQGFRIKLDTDLREIDVRLNAIQKTQLYFVIKEAIANTVKYARATLITIVIRYQNQSCIFSICDNGEGISAEAMDGIGLQSMSERVRNTLQGIFKIKSGATGTCIEGSFPLELAGAQGAELSA